MLTITPPHELNEEAKKLWPEVIAELEHSGKLQHVTPGPVARYCEILVLWRRKMTEALEEQVPMVDHPQGSQGQSVASVPSGHAKVLDQYFSWIERYEKAFGFASADNTKTRVKQNGHAQQHEARASGGTEETQTTGEGQAEETDVAKRKQQLIERARLLPIGGHRRTG